MPTTPAGTAYTVRTATTAEHGTVVWGVADAHAADADLPTLLYCHGSGGAPDQFAALSAWSGLRNWIIDNGWAWVEGTGGTPADGAESWGNQNARNAYQTYLAHADTVLDIGPIVVLGRSMGGLVAYWLYTQAALAARCAGLIINSGVTDLAETGTRFTPKIWNAYGASTHSGFTAASVGYDPMLYPAALWDGKDVLQLGGTADDVVPYDTNGAAIRQRWAGRLAIDREHLRPGGDHSAANGSYLDVSPMTDFLVEVTGRGPDPTPGRVFVATARYLRQSGAPYPLREARTG